MAILGIVIAAAWWNWLRPSTANANAPSPEAAQSDPMRQAVVLDLRNSLAVPGIAMNLVGNGREQLALTIRNDTHEALSVRIRPGLIFERADGAGGTVALIESGYLNVPAKRTEPFYLKSVALSSRNKPAPAVYRLTRDQAKDLQALFRHITENPIYGVGAVQTAVLSLRDNLPLSAFAKFPLISGAPPSALNTDVFRVPVDAIISGLQLMRDSGYSMDNLAITVDPQLVVEAMVDPLARMSAIQFYEIDPKHEWLFWREMLSNGPIALRHYALHGIARFFPQVALDMHPRWARSKEVGSTMREAAIVGIAETGHPDALPLFAQLEFEFREDPVLLRKVQQAQDYLKRTMEARRRAIDTQLIAFRYDPVVPRPLYPGLVAY